MRYLKKNNRTACISKQDINIINELINDGFVLMTEDEIKSYLETQEKKNQSFLEFREKQIKLNELTNWFDNYFDKQLTQSQWQDDFTVSHDAYFDKDYANIDELKVQAKLVRDEIRKLREGGVE